MSNTKNRKNTQITPKGEALRKACPFLDMKQTNDKTSTMTCTRSGTELDGKERGYNCYHCVHFPIVNKTP